MKTQEKARVLPEQGVWAEDDIIAEYLQKLFLINFPLWITVLKIPELFF